MSGKFLSGLAVLACLALAAPCRAGDATVDNVKVTKLMGNVYKVEFSGTLSLTDVGGGFEQWAGLACNASQTGTNIQASLTSLTKPTLQAKGSYTATAQVFANPINANWTATATISWYVAGSTIPKTKDGTKGFTVP